MKEKKGMKSAKMPQEHFEKNMGDVPVSGLKYCGEFSGPDDTMKATKGLADYAKKNKMKY